MTNREQGAVILVLGVLTITIDELPCPASENMQNHSAASFASKLSKRFNKRKIPMFLALMCKVAGEHVENISDMEVRLPFTKSVYIIGN